MTSIPVCSYCARKFPSATSLQEHVTTAHTPRPYCDICIEWFSTQADLENHYSTSPAHLPTNSFSCTVCSLTFSSEADLEDHVENSLFHKYTAGHFYCDDCVLWFSDQGALDRHLRDSEEHATQFACVECGRDFDSRRELEAHLLMREYCGRGVRLYTNGDEDDEDDDRESGEGGGVRLHRSERRSEKQNTPRTRSIFGDLDSDHRGNTRAVSPSDSLFTDSPQTTKSYRCLGLTCFRTFCRPSALLQHLDSGTCPSGITRHLVNSVSLAIDRTNAFTYNQLLGASSNGWDIHEVDDIDNTNSHEQPQPKQLPLDDLGPPYQCPLCHKSFRFPTGLQAHMNSPVHDVRIYRCPTTTSGAKHTSVSDDGQDDVHAGRGFSTLGALTQHLERSGCVGENSVRPRLGSPTRFNAKVKEVQERLKGMALRLEK